MALHIDVLYQKLGYLSPVEAQFYQNPSSTG